jgi:hypothetical protein
LSTLTVLNNADSGDGSLRAAIAAAQSGDTIVFDPTSLAHETITLSSGPLELSSDLVIDGPGADLLAVSGNQLSRIFELSGSAQVTLANLTLTEGMSGQGGAIFIAGNAALTLDGDNLSNNQAVGDSHGKALGGAIYNSAGASLTVGNTVFVNNQSNGTEESFGGAIANAGTLAIDGAAFTANAALGCTTNFGSEGGAIGNQDGATASIKRSAFSGNQALGNGAGSAAGGAIGNEDLGVFPFTGRAVTTAVSQCTFENNTAMGGSKTTNGGYGGAIEDQPGVTLTVVNCSFMGNKANSGGGTVAAGGAIDNSPADTVMISDSQFVSNSAIGSGVGAQASGGAVDNFQTMTIANSSFTGNSTAGGPMADGTHTVGQAEGGAIFTGDGALNGVTVTLTLSNSLVAGNEAIGGSGGSTLANLFADAGAGGGIENLAGGTLNIAGCTITGNQAIGGASGSGSGGVADGGGITNAKATVNLMNSTVSNNLCQGGMGGTGSAGGRASGSGIANDGGAIAIITNSTVSFNQSLGGAGGAGANGGSAAGGGIANASFAWFGFADTSTSTVSNCAIFGNMAQGGTAGSSAVGGDGSGGGIFVASGAVKLEEILVSGNQSEGGADSQGNTSGNGLGGGVYVDPSATATADAQTIIAGNHATKDKDDVFGSINPPP